MGTFNPLVSIGMPVFNGERFLETALNSLLSQKYSNLEIIIIDNCSTDRTQTICESFAEKDSRISYRRNERNMGASWSFRRCFELSKGTIFMWAAYDDFWESEFIKSGVEYLSLNDEYSAWFCTLDAIDCFGRIVRELPGFNRFSSTDRKLFDVIKYLFDSEGMGKANLIYAMFRRVHLEETMGRYYFEESYGSDMCFNLAFIIKYKIFVSEDRLFKKRLIRSTDVLERVDKVPSVKPNEKIFRLNKGFSYAKSHYLATKGTIYCHLVSGVMIIRILLSARNYLTSLANSILWNVQHNFRKIYRCK